MNSQLLGVFALATLVLSGIASADAVPKELQTLLESADELQLFSLRPSRVEGDSKEAFHGWEVLGRMTLADDKQRKEILAAFKKGVEESDGKVAACFQPRHGIRAIRGEKTVDFVICFECLQVQVFAGAKQERGFLITSSPQVIFDRVLASAKVPLAEKAKKDE